MQFAVVGNPISHSLSPRLHNAAFAALRLNGSYGRIFFENEKDFQKLREFGLCGANITVPFKENAYALCDTLSDNAKQIGAVNTICFRTDGSLNGFNTDCGGFYKCIESYGFKTALIIGAGGSARAVAVALQTNNFKTTLINRSKPRLEFFENLGIQTALSSELEAILENQFDIVINTTPSGLVNADLPLDPKICSHFLQKAQMAFDLVYGKNTPFLALAQKLKKQAQDGRSMLINQAILAFLHFMENAKIKVEKKVLQNAMNAAI